jgi:hypothetical protein
MDRFRNFFFRYLGSDPTRIITQTKNIVLLPHEKNSSNPRIDQFLIKRKFCISIYLISLIINVIYGLYNYIAPRISSRSVTVSYQLFIDANVFLILGIVFDFIGIFIIGACLYNWKNFTISSRLLKLFFVNILFFDLAGFLIPLDFNGCQDLICNLTAFNFYPSLILESGRGFLTFILTILSSADYFQITFNVRSPLVVRDILSICYGFIILLATMIAIQIRYFMDYPLFIPIVLYTSITLVDMIFMRIFLHFEIYNKTTKIAKIISFIPLIFTAVQLVALNLFNHYFSLGSFPDIFFTIIAFFAYRIFWIDIFYSSTPILNRVNPNITPLMLEESV